MSTQFRSRTASRRPSQASMISADDLPTAADAFPRRAGSVLRVSKRDAGFVSPTKGTFSFEDAEELPPHAINSLPDLIDEKQIARHVSRGAPGDQSLMNMVKRNASTRDGEDASKRNTQYYTEVFAYREPNLSTREKIHKFSVITAEVKTNVIVRDEYVFLNDLSQQLSQRYQRPASSIFITLDHSACLLFAGTFDSAYILTITALPSQIQATTNKRNAALLQTFMTDSLGVSADRGIVRFSPVPEENLATKGTTILGEIEALRKVSDEETGPNLLERSKSRLANRPKELPLRGRSDSKPKSKVTSRVTSPAPLSPALKSPSLPPIPAEKSALDRKAEKVQRMGRRKSFLSVFGKREH